MIALKELSKTLATDTTVNTDRLDVSRLVVLVPNRGTNVTHLARIIWSLAKPCGLPVMYLALSGHDDNQDTGARLRMISLASLTRDESVQAEMSIFSGDNWVRAVKQTLMQGDITICYCDQRTYVPGLGVRPLYDVLEQTLHMPVYVVPDGLAGVTPSIATTDGMAQPLARYVRRLLIISVFGFIIVAQFPLVYTALTRIIAFFSMALRASPVR